RPGIEPFAGSCRALLARAPVEPLAGAEEAKLARPPQPPLAGAGIEGLAGTEVAQLAGAETKDLGGSAQPDLTRHTPAQLAGAERDPLRATGRAHPPRHDVRRGAGVPHPRSVRLPDGQDLSLGSCPEAADHNLPGPVDDMRPALHGADRYLAVVPFLDIGRRLHGVGEGAGFPACPDDGSLPLDPVRPSPLERALPPGPEALVPDDPLAVQPRMRAANVPHAHGLHVCCRLLCAVNADGGAAVCRRLPDQPGRGVHGEPFH